MIEGNGAYSRLKYESGIHRCNVCHRRNHRAKFIRLATVAVLPEVEDVEIQIDANDLRIDVYRSSGHGGRSVKALPFCCACNSFAYEAW